jgi:hypothetical protein
MTGTQLSHVEPDPEAPPVRIGEQFELPSRFFATVEPGELDLPICHLTVTIEGGQPVCDGVRLERRPGAPPIRSATLRRLHIPDYVDLAADSFGQWVIPGKGPITVTFPDGETYPLRSAPSGDDHVATPISGMTRTPEYKAAKRAPRERGRVTDETLQEVARVYREALIARRPPTREVEAVMHRSRSTAGRWVMRARQKGFLGSARPRRAGEAD